MGPVKLHSAVVYGAPGAALGPPWAPHPTAGGNFTQIMCSRIHQSEYQSMNTSDGRI